MQPLKANLTTLYALKQFWQHGQIDENYEKFIWHSYLGNNFGQEYFQSIFMSYTWDKLKQVQAYKHGGFKHQISSTSVGHSNDAIRLGQFLDHSSFQGREALLLYKMKLDIESV
jgi:hypothetical protein